ncbi:hypothetical protein NKR23_g9216 [Pleurostoma richardsiae]|uniref:Transmembrane protein n=1 Tax=Pleurostoma richardsiae TaxID=41990 RepID=A0AA38RNH6_9PEZI|nr:hypothetical protein NKR23_g9216 [Pleurostoma richardsiae]
MAIPRVVSVLLGTLTALATSALLALDIVLAQALSDPTSSVRITAILSAVLEALVLCLFLWLLATYSKQALQDKSKLNGLFFGLGVVLCVVAAAVSVAALVCLSNASTKLSSSVLGPNAVPFLIGASVALGLAFAAQLIFLVVHFVLVRMHRQDRPHSLHTQEDGNRSPQPHVKSIRYSQTSPSAKTRGSTSIDSKSPPGSSGGRSAAETMGSIRSSFSHVVRPISSKTRLLPHNTRRPASLDSIPHRDRSSMPEDGFDSWDTSAVDPHNRRTVLESSSPIPGRFLETIPASPSTSRSPSPGTPLDLEPPRTRRRSRSYSPATSKRSLQTRPSFTQQPSASESHIHPLFRSDSPTPPPAVSPGTVVIAAPNAGLFISDRQSIRSLTRMRSGSLPAVPSPLSRQGSFDDFGRKIEKDGKPLQEEAEETEETKETAEETERKMTPPIPDWILSAGPIASPPGIRGRRGEEGSTGNEEERARSS